MGKKNNKQQIDLAEKLQMKLLESFETMLDSGDMTPADRATLSRLLMANGWSLDPALVPEGIRAKLTQHIDPTIFDDSDADLPQVN